MKRWKLLLIGALAALDLGVIALAFNPNVSDQYRAFFIERTTDCWPADVSGEIVPGQRISFLKADSKGPAKTLRRCGWLDAEGTGTWSIGPESRLLLILPQPDRATTLELDMLPFTAEGHPTQRVEITANGRSVASLKLDAKSAARHEIELPAGTAEPDGRLELALHFPDAVSPRDLGRSNDRRKLAARLIFLTLR